MSNDNLNSLDKDSARLQIASLVDKYNEVAKDSDGYKRYNEEMTKLRFINPLFQALGWDIENINRKDEVTFEDRISKGRVDYGFRINGIPKFFLEAKALKVNIENPEYAKQAIDYAWNKGCTWAILSDFESLKIFNAEWRTNDYSQNHLKTIQVHEFLERFEELWLLSKDSFEKGLLDKEAEKWGKKVKKTPVDKQLLADFTRFRESLSKNIAKLNLDKKLTQEELDEAVQRILDRLIFIRYCEDRELEEKRLISNLREWENRGRGQLIKQLRDVFNYFDDLYNSKIFDKKDLCNTLDVDNDVLHEIIEGLHYTKDRTIFYDFSVIEADVLGNIYEQYLGHILRKTERRATLTESQKNRKEHGIFYTPTFITEYIIQHTLGKVLSDKKTDYSKIKILDPACGSGSFLIKAFDILNKNYATKDKDYLQTKLDLSLENATYTKKLQILKDHIFGVDLDRQAVEVAQLNLLLKVAEKGRRLPLLQENIKQGNSLVSKSLFAEDKAFEWEKEFLDIIKTNGGFDVIIGNPPYVRQETLKNLKEVLSQDFKVFHPSADLYTYFIERGMSLLKQDGYLGFVVSNKWLRATYGGRLRNWMKQFQICEIIDFGDLPVFEDATAYPCILVLKKTPPKDNFEVTQVKTLEFGDLESYVRQNKYFVSQNDLDESGWSLSGHDVANLVTKLKGMGIPFGKFVDSGIYYGIKTGLNEAFVIDEKTRQELIKKDGRSREIIKQAVSGRDIKRYNITPKNIYIIFTRRGIDISKYPAIKSHLEKFRTELTPRKSDKEKVGRKPGSYEWYEIQDTVDYFEHFERPKIMLPDIATRGNFAFDFNQSLYPLNTAYVIANSDPYLLGILNSKLITFLYRNISTSIRGGYLRFIYQYLIQLPIVPQEEAGPQAKVLTKLVERMNELYSRLAIFGEKVTDERRRVESEINSVDSEIDDIVFKIYGLNDKERRIIEEFIL